LVAKKEAAVVKTVSLLLATEGVCDIQEVTGEVSEAIRASGITDGIVTVFVPGATGGVTTIEFEPGAVQDFQAYMERSIPSGGVYRHNERWGDGNGFSHVRAAALGPSLTVPFQEGRLLLGTWQQIVVADFDNRPRQRTVILQILGE
jgi:secondary thiamine-phosphate synthase enzyme